MTISGILFDFDGTLANTTPLILHCFHQTFSHFYGKVPPDEKILTTFGLPMPQAMLQLSGGDEAHLDELLTFYRTYQLSVHDEMIRPFPSVLSGCQRLKEKGIHSIIVTSKTNETCERGLRCLELSPYIEGVIGVRDTALHKPDPEPSLLALKKLGLSGEECLCVGDSPYDLVSGMRAGCRASVKVGWSSFDPIRFQQEIKPNYTIASLPELLPIIESLNQQR